MKTCDCCGKEIEYYSLIENKFAFCDNCKNKYINFVNGKILRFSLINEHTIPELKDYLKKCSEEMDLLVKQDNYNDISEIIQVLKEIKINTYDMTEQIEKMKKDIHFVKVFITICILLYVIGVVILGIEFNDFLHKINQPTSFY